MPRHPKSLVVPDDRPLRGVIVQINGEDVTQYFVDDEDAKQPMPESVVKALSLAGAWTDMDWDSALEELELIGHETAPTPPTEL